MNIPSRHQSIIAAFLILQRGKKILLSKRCHTGYRDGYYSLIAGHVNAGETFIQAIIREAKEEAGIVLKPEYLRVVHIMHRKSETDRFERVDTYFLAKRWQGTVINQEPEKCSGLAWFLADQLPPNLIDSVGYAIQQSLKKIPYSEYGWTQSTSV